MSAERHTPAERAAYRQALDDVERRHKAGVPPAAIVYDLRESHPALPPLPVIERWVVVGPDGVNWHGTHLSAPSTWPTSMTAPAGSRIYRLEAVEEVTPTAEPVRVTMPNGDVWTKGPAGWRCDQKGASFGPYEDFLDRILELEAGRND